METHRQSMVRVLMIGWEFPPFITGGLGTACYGLTRAMDRRGLEVTFVLPKPTDGQGATHVRLMSPEKPAAKQQPSSQDAPVYAREQEAGQSPDAVAPEPSAQAPEQEQPRQSEGGAPERAAPPEQSPPRRTPTMPRTPEGVPTTAEPFTEPFRHVRFIGIPADAFPVYEPPVGNRDRDDEMGDGDELHVREGEGASEERPPEQQMDVQPEAHHSQQDPFHTKRSSAAHEAPSVPHSTPEQESPESPQPEPHEQQHQPQQKVTETDYDGDIMTIVDRYAEFCLAQCRDLDFDVIHVHDWMTYPAGMRVARATGKPLVAHIHSTEFDRSGEHVNPQIYDIERRGMQAAMRVVAVSQLTKNVVINKYHIPDERIEVVYNGVDLEPSAVGITGIRSKDKIVLYFGRITYQKGPEYFIRAAKRVLEVLPDVKFVVAGSGDLAKRMIEMAAEMGIGHKVLFTGFLRGDDIKRVFSLADLYVMPSISEPFGIAPLEAMSHNVPVLISRSSGVSEVLNHALKVDFWDVDDMANKIVAVLRHPPLSNMLKEHGAFEVRRLTWDGAAERCEQIYRAVQMDMVETSASRTGKST